MPHNRNVLAGDPGSAATPRGDKVSLAALRVRPYRSKPWVNVRRSEIDALVEAVDAAQAAWDSGIALGGTDEWLRLRDALARFQVPGV